MRALVMGCSRVGARLTRQLLDEGHEVRVMDASRESFLRIPPEHREAISFHGDGTRMEDLERAGIREADTFVAVTTRDTHNAMAAQIARNRFGVPRVICSLNDPARQEMYRKLGLETISPVAYIQESIIQALRA